MQVRVLSTSQSWRRKLLRTHLTFAIATLSFAAAGAPDETTLESSICGPQESSIAAGWRDRAESRGRLDPAGIVATPITFSVNGVVLHGFKRHSSSPDSSPSPSKGALLVIQGNGTLAERIMDEFSVYASSGLDVYIVDFRGYGDSQGNPYLKAIVADFAEVARRLSVASNGHLFIYGMSFGAGVALKVLNQGIVFRAAVIDSAPSRFLRLKALCIFPIETLKCPEDYQPENNVPANARNVLFLHGASDSLIRSCDAEQLKSQAERNGARYEELPGHNHPLAEPPPLRNVRHQIILKFLQDHF